MINNFTIGQYYPVDSPIHRLDPRTKITCVFIYIISLFLAADYLSYILTLIASLGLVIISRVPFMTLVRGLKPILILVILTAFFHLFLTPGRIIWSCGFFEITGE